MHSTAGSSLKKSAGPDHEHKCVYFAVYFVSSVSRFQRHDYMRDIPLVLQCDGN